jgi:CO dehydrogenase/acetyl-CoA synthase delta subunit
MRSTKVKWKILSLRSTRLMESSGQRAVAFTISTASSNAIDNRFAWVDFMLKQPFE